MKKSQAYYKLSTPDRLLCLSGIPIAYLNGQPGTMNFQAVVSSISGKAITIDPKSQQEFFQQFLSESTPVGKAGLYAIGSSPEVPAYHAAISVCRSYQELKFKYNGFPRINWIDVGSPNWDLLKTNEQEFDLIVIHGIADTSEQRRLETARDFIHKSSYTTTFLVANTKNVLDMCWNRIGVEPNGIFQFGRTVHRTVT